MKYHFKVHGNKKSGFWAECLELAGCQSQGDTLEELKSNLQEALDLYLSEPEDSNTIFPLPAEDLKAKKDVILVAATPSVAIAAYIKRLRISNRLTQHGMKDALGFKNLSAYQKLENPKGSNPEFKTLVKIKKAFPEFNLDVVAS